MSWILFAYVAGVFINLVVVLAVREDLVEVDKPTARARVTVLSLAVLMSFVTWVLVIIGIVCAVLNNLRPKNDGTDIH